MKLANVSSGATVLVFSAPLSSLHLNLLSGEDLGASFTGNPPSKGKGAGMLPLGTFAY